MIKKLGSNVTALIFELTIFSNTDGLKALHFAHSIGNGNQQLTKYTPF